MRFFLTDTPATRGLQAAAIRIADALKLARKALREEQLEEADLIALRHQLEAALNMLPKP